MSAMLGTKRVCVIGLSLGGPCSFGGAIGLSLEHLDD